MQRLEVKIFQSNIKFVKGGGGGQTQESTSWLVSVSVPFYVVVTATVNTIGHYIFLKKYKLYF